MWEGQQTNNDLFQIKALANTDTTTWPDEYVKVHLNNYLADQTVNRHAKLKLCVGARLMLIDNVSVSARLINSSIATVQHLDRRSEPLCSTIL